VEVGVPILKGLDVIAPAMVLGQAIGRWATSSTRRPSAADRRALEALIRPRTGRGFGQFEYFHPTFLYESIWTQRVHGLVAWLRPSLRQHRARSSLLHGLYSIGRFAIEALRLDSFWLGASACPSCERARRHRRVTGWRGPGGARRGDAAELGGRR